MTHASSRGAPASTTWKASWRRGTRSRASVRMWLSVTLEAEAGRAEALSEALMDQGALSVSIEDADAGTEAERPQFGEPGHLPTALWDHSRVVALVEADTELLPLLAAAAAQAGLDAVPFFTVEEVAEQNWVQLTQRSEEHT